MSDIKLIYNYQVVNDVGVNNSWRENIKVDFVPDVVKVKAISYHNDTATTTEAGLGRIYTNLIRESYLGTFKDGSQTNPEQIFTLKRPINDSFLFQVRELNGDLIVDMDGDLVIDLSFIQYHERK